MERQKLTPEQVVSMLKAQGNRLSILLEKHPTYLADVNKIVGLATKLLRNVLSGREIFDDLNPDYRSYTFKREAFLGRLSLRGVDSNGAQAIRTCLDNINAIMLRSRDKVAHILSQRMATGQAVSLAGGDSLDDDTPTQSYPAVPSDDSGPQVQFDGDAFARSVYEDQIHRAIPKSRVARRRMAFLNEVKGNLGRS